MGCPFLWERVGEEEGEEGEEGDKGERKFVGKKIRNSEVSVTNYEYQIIRFSTVVRKALVRKLRSPCLFSNK